MMAVCFRNIKRLVASVLLMHVVVSNAVEDAVKDPRAGVPPRFLCSRKCLELRVAILEDRLSRLEDTCCSSAIKESCTVDLASYGFDDSPIYGYVRTSGGSSDETYDPEQIYRYRGVTILELDLKTCNTSNRQRFETDSIILDTSSTSWTFVNTLERANTGTIIIGVTARSAANHHGEFYYYAGQFFSSYNMNLTGLQVGDKFAFIMQKGYPNKTVFQRKPGGGESLQMKIELRGSTVQDVSFHQI